MRCDVLIVGLLDALLIATLQYTEYRFVTIEHSVELQQRSMKDWQPYHVTGLKA